MNFTEQFTNYTFDFEFIRLPNIDISKEEKEYENIFDKDISNVDFLRKLVSNNLTKFLENKKIPVEKYQEYSDRAEKEFETFVELDFVNYILLIWKIMNFCKRNNITTSYGRGSCCGSICFWLIGITFVDSVKFSLFFERFISKARAKKKIVDGVTYLDSSLLPDVDLDFDYSRRHEVIGYLNSLYPDQTSKILNSSTFTSKILIKDTAKVVGNLSEQDVNQVSDMIGKHFGIVQSLTEAYSSEPQFKQWCDQHEDIYQTALKLADLNRSNSTHASGFTVSYDPIIETVPLMLSKDKEICSVYSKDDVSCLAIKVDLLGLRCASVIGDVCKQLNIDWKNIDIEHEPIIYDNLKKGILTPRGLFQIESGLNLQVCNQIKPESLEELASVIALARPGSCAFIPQYLKNKSESNIPSTGFDKFDEVLKDTHGVCIFQESMLKLSSSIGFTLEQSEQLRRIVGRKKVEEVKEWKEKIYQKCQENHIPESIADLLWKILDDSSKYSFNKSHALAYASLTALTIYLKYTYPQNFYIALLNQAKMEANVLEEINLIQTELYDFGIKLLPPSLTASSMDFTVDKGDIRYGLASLRGISDKTMEKLLNFRKSYSNRFEIFEAAEQAKINIATLSCLIQSGCLESDAKDRSELVYEAQLYRLLTPTEKKYVHNIFQSNKSLDLRGILHYMIKHTNEKGKPYIKDSRLETLKRHSAPYKEIYEKNSKYSKLAIYYYEKQNMGFPYTYNLRQINPEFEKSLDTLRDIRDNKDKNEHIFSVCEVLESRKATSRKGTPYLKVTLQDETGTIQAMAFNSERSATIDFIMEENGGVLPKEGDIVFIKGKKQDDSTVFFDRMDIQTAKIYTKLAQLKNDIREK